VARPLAAPGQHRQQDHKPQAGREEFHAGSGCGLRG
jgi:hypothetical protein